MNTFKNVLEMSEGIRALAKKAMKNLPSSSHAYVVACRQAVRPIDYMRYAEFETILRNLKIDPQMEILDVSSPQWFSIFLANHNQNTTFHYMNIIDTELDPYIAIANALGIDNIKYHKGDVRELEFDSNTFDKVISISVIEHVYPEVGGDQKALVEIKRVLKPEGELLITVPYKAKRNIIYMDVPVYERSSKSMNFFAREYDKEMFDGLLERSEFVMKDAWFICEKKGIASVDYYEWGPGKNNLFAKYLVKSRYLAERIIKKSIDEMLARRYLIISKEITSRVVNISARLVKNQERSMLER